MIDGRGTSFHVLLPAMPSAPHPEDEVAPVEHQGDGMILVMDDEEFNLDILSAMLRSMGYKTLEARDGDDALRLCSTVPSLKAAFLDLTNKGGLGGKGTVGPLRGLAPGLPVFAVSGYSSDAILSNPVAYGFTASLGKPFHKSELSALLARHLPGS